MTMRSRNEAPQDIQEIWAAYREPRFARSGIVCTNVAEPGVTVPNVGLVQLGLSNEENESTQKPSHTFRED